jgi:trans-2,3-dihydro-3-hydroxyanthranilate isomerase
MIGMANLNYYLVDVFAQRKFAGNQLAVFPNTADLSTERMQQIANEMHFSETTFIQSSQLRNGGYDVKIFTPQREVPFAGHPTIGTAYIIKHFIANQETDTIKLNLTVGQIPVTFIADAVGKETLWMKQKSPVFKATFSIQQMAQVLQLSTDCFDNRYPIQEVTTGLPFVIVPLKSLEAIKKAKIDLSVLRKMSGDIHGGILVFCPQTIHAENNLHVRVFVDLFGIPEDPATGSGNGCLAGYLSHYRYYGSDVVDARVEQGYEIKRPSLLFLKAQTAGETVEVHVGGQVVLVAHGTLL